MDFDTLLLRLATIQPCAQQGGLRLYHFVKGTSSLFVFASHESEDLGADFDALLNELLDRRLRCLIGRNHASERNEDGGHDCRTEARATQHGICSMKRDGKVRL